MHEDCDCATCRAHEYIASADLSDTTLGELLTYAGRFDDDEVLDAIERLYHRARREAADDADHARTGRINCMGFGL